ncbi:MAG: hypothetical protein N4A49_15875, partial [Marinifilaceae bacterium]|nr:hypothetical protein [Marinifilaceae bacterium]
MRKSFIIILILKIFINLNISAQNYPVRVNMFLTAPHSVYLSDYYADGSNRMNVYLLLNDYKVNMLRVKLRIKIYSNRVSVQTKALYQ